MISSCWRRICSSCWRISPVSQEERKKTSEKPKIINLDFEIRISKFGIPFFASGIAHRREKGIQGMELQIGIGLLLRADGGGHLGRVVMAGEYDGVIGKLHEFLG